MDDLFLPDSNDELVWKSDNLDQLLPKVYTELKRLAAYHLKNEKPNHTLSPTALVNEVYLIFKKQRLLDLSNRLLFLSLASTFMRRILVNYAKERNRQKRGDGIPDLSLPEIEGILTVEFEKRQIDVISLENALLELGKKDKRKVRIVELHFYGGLTFEEIAELLSISQRQVMRDWRFSRTWLYKHLSGGETK